MSEHSPENNPHHIQALTAAIAERSANHDKYIKALGNYVTAAAIVEHALDIPSIDNAIVLSKAEHSSFDQVTGRSLRVPRDERQEMLESFRQSAMELYDQAVSNKAIELGLLEELEQYTD